MSSPTQDAAVITCSGDSADELAPASSSESVEKEIRTQEMPAPSDGAPNDSETSPVTPTRPIASQESVVDESSPSSVDDIGEKSLPGSGAITPVASTAAEDSEDGVTSCPKWSDVLKSPSHGEQFSPSRELNRPGSLHGAGLSVAVDRAKKLSKCGRRCATMLYDIATLYDSFAQSILKSCQSLQSPMAGTPVAGLSNACTKSLVSFAKQMQGLAICLRGSVARPLHGSNTTLGETAPSVYNRYAKTRVKSFGARKSALQVRSKYVKAVREAEAAIRVFKQARRKQDDQQNQGSGAKAGPEGVAVSSTSKSSEGGSDTQTYGSLHPKGWEKSLKMLGQKHGASADQVIRVLNEVQALESQYCKLVDEENQAVSQSQTMEVMALEAIQELEEERLHFFVETMKRTLQAEKGALDKMVLSSAEDQDRSPDAISKEEKKGNVFTSLLKTASSQFDSQFDVDEGVGIMEADTLGLPEDVGSLRDEVRACLSARASRAQSTKAVVLFFEEVASACSTLAAEVTSRLGQEGYGPKRRISSPNGLLAVALEKNEGAHVLTLWTSTVTTIGDSAEAASRLSEALKTARQKTLNSTGRSENEAKAVGDVDDQKWKRLCDAARTETKAQSRYRQTSDDYEKARSRVRSVDGDKTTSEHEGGATTPDRGRSNSAMSQGMTKAFGNMISILPHGGEHALKIMSPDARRKFARTSLEEANEKEAKGKQALDTAVSMRAMAIKNYTDSAKSVVDSFGTEDQAAWAMIRSTLESSTSSFQAFRRGRYDSLGQSSQLVEVKGNSSIVADMVEWTRRAKKHVARKAKQSGQEGGASERSGSFIKRMPSLDADDGMELGFSLHVQLEKSKNVYQLLALVGSDGEGPDLEDEPETQLGVPLQISDKSDNVGTDQRTTPPKVLRRSLTEPLSPSTRELISLSEMLREEADSNRGETIPLKPRLNAVSATSTGATANKAENEVFLTHFWSDRDVGESPPTVIESFSCAYWPKEGEGHISPLLHGRLFATSSTMYFVGWGGKKIVLSWKDVTKVNKEKSMMGTIDNALRVSFNSESGESSYFFGSFATRENAFQLIDRLSTIAKSLNEMVPSEEGRENLPPVPPDNVLKKMEVLISKRMRSVPVQQFYDVVWSEGNRTESEPFYGPWCEYMGSRKVKVTDWEFSEDGTQGFLHPWDGERYPQRRVTEFEFTRTTHLYIGPPVAQVKETHWCRVEGNDKVVLAMTVEMNGIPYSDCFVVEVRWVSRREGPRDLLVEVGVFVNFKKSTMFASKIRSGTLTETKPIHLQLFDAAKKACAAVAGVEGDEAGEEEAVSEEKVGETMEFSMGGIVRKVGSVFQNPPDMDVTTALITAGIMFLVIRFISKVFGVGHGGTGAASDEVALLGERIDELQTEMRKMHHTLEEILSMMKKSQEGTL